MKNIIVCMDGTWNKPEKAVEDPAEKDNPTNVLKIYRGLATRAESETLGAERGRQNIPQVAYYHLGVGTDPGLWDRFVGGALGAGISRDITDAYRFLCANYEDGDRIYLFGFSRGAYAARSLAGFIGQRGLIKKHHMEWTPEAYKVYRTAPDERHASPFAAAIARVEQDADEKISRHPIPIHFIGVFDTVGALGAPTPLLGSLSKKWVGFFNTRLGGNVKHAYHAVAIDERRRPFQPDLWTTAPGATAYPDQRVEQVWFTGVHTNIGGSYSNEVLSEFSLRWMLDRASECGLDFGPDLWALDPKLEDLENAWIYDSYSTLYKIIGLLRVKPYDREIGPNQHGDIRNHNEPAINESVHESAVAAMQNAYPFDGRGEPKDAERSGKGRKYVPEQLKKALGGANPLSLWKLGADSPER